MPVWTPEIYRRELVELLGLSDKNWSCLIVGDGSGSRWGYGTGWGAILFFPGDEPVQMFHGASNNGTVNTAELFAYAHPLLWYVANVPRTAGEHIYILTDSQYSAGMINSRQPPRLNAPLWYFFNSLRAAGIELTATHSKRETTEANRISDEISKYARITMQEYSKSMGVEVEDGNAIRGSK